MSALSGHRRARQEPSRGPGSPGPLADRPRQAAVALVAWALLTALIPLVAAWATGQPLSVLLQFPLSQPAWDAIPPQPALSAAALLLTGLIIAGFIWVGWPRKPASIGPVPQAAAAPSKTWPRSAWLALMFAIAAMIAADGGAVNAVIGLLNLALTFALNADTERRTGRSLLGQHRRYFLMLFPVSLVAGWVCFYWLNLFTQLWTYPQATEAVPFALGKSLDYATMLPAMLSLRHWLASFPALLRATQRGPVFWAQHDSNAEAEAWLLLCLGGLSLSALAIWPEWLFPTLWIAPLLLALGAQKLRRQPSCLVALQRGDWSRPLLAILATALLLGLGEAANQALGPAWVYQLPMIADPSWLQLTLPAPVPAWLSILPLALLGLTLADQTTKLLRQPPPGPGQGQTIAPLLFSPRNPKQ